MSVAWFYVEGSERVGPIEDHVLKELITKRSLGAENYVWKKGFDNWVKVKDIPDLKMVMDERDRSEQKSAAIPEKINLPRDLFSWDDIGIDDQVFSIKTGLDRNGVPTEYGPFSLSMLAKLYKEKRVSAKTYMFAPGMEHWMLLGDIPVHNKLFFNAPPVIEEVDRRKHVRRPFVARILFHDNAEVYEGTCRDVSIGGMQILVANFPGTVGEKISVNVHPDNTDFHFVTSGLIVRGLSGNQGVAVRFTDVSAKTIDIINQYLNS